MSSPPYTTRERLEGSGYKVFTLADLRARDEAIIEATLCHFDPNPPRASRADCAAIIATTEQP